MYNFGNFQVQTNCPYYRSVRKERLDCILLLKEQNYNRYLPRIYRGCYKNVEWGACNKHGEQGNNRKMKNGEKTQRIGIKLTARVWIPVRFSSHISRST